MQRAITGFSADEEGDWVAELDCLHRQHVRHRPPLWPRPWVEDAAARAARVGTPLDCPPLHAGRAATVARSGRRCRRTGAG